jgi:hypothetical protein
LGSLILSGWPRAKEPAHAPIVFIDDLDRCSPDNLVAFLEQIRNIILQNTSSPRAFTEAGAPSSPSDGGLFPCRFVIAVDHQILVRAIASKFAALGSYDGHRYLEKAFPFAFRLPTPGNDHVGALLAKLMAELEIEESKRVTWEGALKVALHGGQFANPRFMKRCINRFVLVQRIEERAGPMPGAGHNSDVVLAKWLAATERWPLMRRLALQEEPYLQELGKLLAGEKSANTWGSDIEGFLGEPGAAAWIRQEFLGSIPQYRAAELRLRRGCL